MGCFFEHVVFLRMVVSAVLVLSFGGGVNNDSSVLGKRLAGVLEILVRKFEKGVSVRFWRSLILLWF